MKRRTRHSVRILRMMALVLLCAQPAAGQSVSKPRIENKAVMECTLFDGFSLSSESNLVWFEVQQAGELTFRKSVSPVSTMRGDTLVVGDTLRYVLRVENTGNTSLTNVEIRDTIPTSLDILTVSGNAQFSGNIISATVTTMSTGRADSVSIIARLRSDLPDGLVVVNAASARSDQTPLQIDSVAIVASAVRSLLLTKTVSADTIVIGDSVHYVLRVENTGNTLLTNVEIRDTIPTSLDVLAISGNAQQSGNVVSCGVTTMPAGDVDSVWITARLRSDLPNRLTVINTASAASDQITARQYASCGIVTKVVVPDRSCSIGLRVIPRLVIGNGTEASVIEAFVSDTTGRPKPNGTPVTFTTTVGVFSNGQNSITVPVVDGSAVDSVRALIVDNSIDTAYVTASANDEEVCSASSSTIVIFYPGAIAGTVRDEQTLQPLAGALVQVFSSTNTLVGSMETAADGKYFIAVPRTDTYRVTITITNAFGELFTSTMYVSITVPATGGNPPVSGNNQITGSLYYLVSHRPIPTAGFKLLLNPITAPLHPGHHVLSTSAPSGAIDSTVTDSTGAYRFDNVAAGSYEIALSDPWLRGSDTVQNAGGGEILFNVNIPVVLNPILRFSKQGPTRVSLSDTASYIVSVEDSGTLSLTNAVVIDTLDARMEFLSTTGSGVYDAAGHRITWNVGTLSPGSQVQYEVRVAFADTVRNAFTAVNRAFIASDEIVPASVQTSTSVLVPTQLHIWKTSSVSSAQPGDTVLYTITAENASGATAESLRVNDALPSEVRFVSAVPEAQYDSTTHGLRWSIASLKVGQQWQAVVSALVRSDLPSGEFTYTNMADLVWRDSSATSSADPRSHAQVTTVVSYLRVQKQAVRKIVDIGDIATYVVRITNTSNTSWARSVVLADHIPFGFAYLDNSSVLDSTRTTEPTGREELRWNVADSLPPNTTRILSYRLAVGGGAIEGTGVNTAQAFAATPTGLPLVSALAAERVEVRRGVFTERGLIIGKVFYDDNRNDEQDGGEEGVKGVELMMEDGTRIITGDDGKYSLPDVPPGQHVIKVRQHTLPKGAALVGSHSGFAGDPSSRFVRLTESNIARADFYLTREVRKARTVTEPGMQPPPNDETTAPPDPTPVETGGHQRP